MEGAAQGVDGIHDCRLSHVCFFSFCFSLKQRKKMKKKQRSCRMGRTEVRGQTCLRALQHFLTHSSLGSRAPFGAPRGPLGAGGGFWIRWRILDQVDGSGSGGSGCRWLWWSSPWLVLWLCPGTRHLPAPVTVPSCHGLMSQSCPVLSFQGCFTSSKGHTWKGVRGGGGAAPGAEKNPAQRAGTDRTHSGALSREVPELWDCHLLSPCPWWPWLDKCPCAEGISW